MKNVWFKFLAKLLLVSGALFLGYYAIFLRPALAVPKALNDAEKIVASHNLNLVQNRTALTAFTRLNLQSANFADEKKQILEKLVETNRAGLIFSEKKEPLPHLRLGAKSELSQFLNAEFPEKLSRLREEERLIFDEQKNLIARLAEFAGATNNIFSYNPTIDLGRLDLDAQRDELMSRAETARDGLETIAQKLDEQGPRFDYALLADELKKSQQILGRLMENLEGKNFSGARDARNEFIAQFAKVQNTAMELELTLIRSDDSIRLATRQTNLIREFDLLLQKINRLQRELE